MINITFAEIFKFIVFLCGFIDAHKYYRQSQKIIRRRTSTSQSRMFLNEALFVDFIFLAYIIWLYRTDWLLITIRILPIITTIHLYWITYIYYPFKYKNLKNFKQPSLWKFFLNTFAPNDIDHRL